MAYGCASYAAEAAADRINVNAEMMRTPIIRMPVLVLAAVLGVAAGCVSRTSVHGDPIEEQRLSSIVTGTHTRSDVAALLGSPSSISPFTEDRWYYISARMEGFAYNPDEEVERQVVVIHFDKQGVVSAVDTLTLEDGRVVNIVERETPSFGEDLSILQQFFGNIGRFEKEAPRR